MREITLKLKILGFTTLYSCSLFRFIPYNEGQKSVPKIGNVYLYVQCVYILLITVVNIANKFTILVGITGAQYHQFVCVWPIKQQWQNLYRLWNSCSFFGFLHEPFKNGKLLSSWSYHEFISMKFSWNHVKCKWDIKLKNIIIHKIFMKSYFQECFHEYYLHEMFAWILHEDYLMQNSWNFHACM